MKVRKRVQAKILRIKILACIKNVAYVLKSLGWQA